MEDNGDFTLNLPCDCFLEIIKYIIADCEQNKEFQNYTFIKYNDLMNFVLAHELFLELFAAHHKKLYQVFELGLERRTTILLIDLRVNKLSNQNRDLFWRSYLHSIREGSSFNVHLSFDKCSHRNNGKKIKKKIYFGVFIILVLKFELILTKSDDCII